MSAKKKEKSAVKPVVRKKGSIKTFENAGEKKTQPAAVSTPATPRSADLIDDINKIITSASALMSKVSGNTEKTLINATISRLKAVKEIIS